MKPPASKSGVSFPLTNHLAMVADQARVSTIMRALDKVLAPGVDFCEVGCGTGVFTLFAASKGCRVVAIERDPTVLSIAQRAVEDAELAGDVTFIEASFEDVASLPHMGRADVVLCEMLSPWLVRESQVAAAAHAKKRLLKPAGRLIPEQVVNRVELGWIEYSPFGVHVPTPAYESDRQQTATVMTEAIVFNIVELGEAAASVEHSVQLKSLASGALNCARLSSIVQLTSGVPFFSSLSMMPIAVVPLVGSVEVSINQRIQFSAQYRYGRSLAQAEFRAVPD